MAWPTLVALVQVIGCPAADADRVGALINLELAGTAVEVVEVRCAPKVSVKVTAGSASRVRVLAADTLQTDGGARLIAIAAADLADELAQPAAPNPPEPDPPAERPVTVKPAAPAEIEPAPSRWHVSLALAGRTQFDDLRPGFGASGQWIDDWRLIELSGHYFPAMETRGSFLNSEARLAQLALALGVILGPPDGLRTGGVLGWSGGWGWMRGVEDRSEGGAVLGRAVGLSVDGPVGGPFVGARVSHRIGRGVIGFSLNQGWAAWTLEGTMFGQPAEAFKGIWLAASTQIGVVF